MNEEIRAWPEPKVGEIYHVVESDDHSVRLSWRIRTRDDVDKLKQILDELRDTLPPVIRVT